jgi:CRISPR-associated protein Csb1
MIDDLSQAHRLVLDARLVPLVGTTFQPTGFPDLGAATFQRPGGPPSVLVESVQSMTNHLEATGWDDAARRPRSPIAGLPYVEVVDDSEGAWLTSSRLEPHRLAAAYVRDAAIDGSTGIDWVKERLKLEEGRPLDWPAIHGAVFEMDPMCLIHGVFFSDKRWHGNPKIRRAVTAVIEARDAAPAVSGGVKRDDVGFRQGEGRGTGEGYGFVPFGRMEFTAREIVLTIAVDVGQIRGYGLPSAATRLVTLVALWEVATLLSEPLRLRTACDLEVEEVTVRRPAAGPTLPSPEELAEAIEGAAVDFERPGALTARWPAPKGA